MAAFCITNYDAICNLGNNIDEIFENAISGKDCFLENDNDFIKGKSFYFGKVAPFDVSIQDEDFDTKTNKMLAYLAKRMNLSKVIDKYGAENVAVVIATTNSGSEEFSQNHNENYLKSETLQIFCKIFSVQKIMSRPFLRLAHRE